MSKVIINSFEDLKRFEGEHIGTSEFMVITQECIDTFARATYDDQWIHTDTERAKAESPYHTTIAHGFLTLSLLPYHWNQIIQVNNLRMMVNYGIDKVKFGQPVLSGQKIRVAAYLHSLKNLRGITKAEIRFQVEIAEEEKWAMEGFATFLYYFNENCVE